MLIPLTLCFCLVLRLAIPCLSLVSTGTSVQHLPHVSCLLCLSLLYHLDLHIFVLCCACPMLESGRNTRFMSCLRVSCCLGPAHASCVLCLLRAALQSGPNRDLGASLALRLLCLLRAAVCAQHMLNVLARPPPLMLCALLDPCFQSGPNRDLGASLARVATGECSMNEAVGPAVGCLMATFGTNMISSCIFEFDDPTELK
jgi:hypothetical protein